MHQRRIIREAIKAILQADARVTNIVPAASIFTNLNKPLPVGKLPAIVIYMEREDSDHEETAPRENRRRVSTMIELSATSKTQGTDDFLDDLAEEVEQVIMEDETLAGTADDTWIVATDFNSDLESRTEKGTLVIVFMIEYYTGAPKRVPGDTFDTLQTTIKDPDSGETIGENLDTGINQE